jgi:polyisoprenoid-binding protein YceI
MMKRLAIVTGILAMAAPLAMAQYSTWTSDPAHSEVDFSIRHGGVSNVHGRIGKVAATLVYNEADISKSTVTATIDTSTVDTGEPAAIRTSRRMLSSTSPSSPPPPSPAPAWQGTAAS